MSVTPQEITKRKLLLGEGKDEINFFSALIRQLGIEDIQVEAYQGKGNLNKYLQTLRVRPNFNQLTSVGITRDADENAVQTFQSITDGLRKAKFPIPMKIGEFIGNRPRIGVFVLPDGQNGGMLEDLCLKVIEANPEI